MATFSPPSDRYANRQCSSPRQAPSRALPTGRRRRSRAARGTCHALIEACMFIFAASTEGRRTQVDETIKRVGDDRADERNRDDKRRSEPGAQVLASEI